MASFVAAEVTPLIALRLSEERACGGYLAARKAMVRAGSRALSLGRLVAEQPNRADYRRAWLSALTAHSEAVQRTQAAWQAWQHAQLRTDSAWTASTGRVPHPIAA